MTIKEIIIKYCRELENISDTPRLDVELLLKRALGDVDSMYIRMYLDKELREEQEKYFLEMMKDRLNQAGFVEDDILQIGSTIGSHVGPEAFGVIFVQKK